MRKEERKPNLLTNQGKKSQSDYQNQKNDQTPNSFNVDKSISENQENENSNIKTRQFKFIDLLMFTIFISGILLGLVFYVRYDSVFLIFITWLISITIPFSVYFLLNAKFSKSRILLITLISYIFLLAIPIGKVKESSFSIIPLLRNITDTKSTTTNFKTCSKHGIQYTGSQCPLCKKEQEDTERAYKEKRAKELEDGDRAYRTRRAEERYIH
jgi:hypothetical protein